MNVNFPIPSPRAEGTMTIKPPTLELFDLGFLRQAAADHPNKTTARLILTAVNEVLWLRHQLQRTVERMIAMENAIALERKLTQEFVTDDDPLSRV